LSRYEIDPAVPPFIPDELTRRYHIIAIERMTGTLATAFGGTLTVAFGDLSFSKIWAQLQDATGHLILPVIALQSQIDDAITKYFGPSEPQNK